MLNKKYSSTSDHFQINFISNFAKNISNTMGKNFIYHFSQNKMSKAFPNGNAAVAQPVEHSVSALDKESGGLKIPSRDPLTLL